MHETLVQKIGQFHQQHREISLHTAERAAIWGMERKREIDGGRERKRRALIFTPPSRWDQTVTWSELQEEKNKCRGGR